MMTINSKCRTDIRELDTRKVTGRDVEALTEAELERVAGGFASAEHGSIGSGANTTGGLKLMGVDGESKNAWYIDTPEK